MSQYSETIGSFTRTGDYPLEANYIFNSELELKDFYSDELNNTLLHKGLLKIVSSEDLLVLYWVVSVDKELQFKPLISANSLEELFNRIIDIRNNLDLEIDNREQAIIDILGTTDKSLFLNELDNLLAISNAIINLQELVDKNTDSIKAISGTEEDNIRDYLETLDYKNLTEISKLLHKFFDSNDEVSILPEFRTLGGIQDFVKTLLSNCIYKNRNLQTELDQTQIGVGLNSDGLFSPDLETNYLKNATSIMNALKTLDSLIASNSGGSNLEVSTVEGNQIDLKSDGIYHNSTLEYSNGTLIHKINGNTVSSHNIGLDGIVDSASYDSTTETIRLVFRLHNGSTQSVEIPVSDLITEWKVDNENNAVELTKTHVVNGTSTLSADVKISTDHNNTLEKRSNGLYVGPTDLSGISIPTKTSELINDSEFITLLDIPEIPTCPDSYDDTELRNLIGALREMANSNKERITSLEEKHPEGVTYTTILEEGKKYLHIGDFETITTNLQATADEVAITQEKLADTRNGLLNLTTRVNNLVVDGGGGEMNTINSIKVNGVTQTIAEDKSVNIEIPEIPDGSKYAPNDIMDWYEG